MKKRLGTVCVGLTILLSLVLLPNANAASSVDDQSSLSVDGVTVIYDMDAVNGGISLNNIDAPKSSSVKSARVASQPSKIIMVPFQTQETNYYCGPASARMVLGAIGRYRTQSQLAGLMGTTTAGTNAGAPVVNALNAVASGSGFKFTWQWHTYSNINTIKDHVTTAISDGNPVMVNTMEFPGDVWLQGHNIGSALYHYGVVADYFDYGNSVTYTDPGYGRFAGFVQDQRVSITNLSYAVGGRGYAW